MVVPLASRIGKPSLTLPPPPCQLQGHGRFQKVSVLPYIFCTFFLIS
jgi:hypothetical protein